MRRDIIVNPITQTVVSIHASVKDATTKGGTALFGTVVSIHASVKDATNGSATRLRRTNSFNPRICKRCDLAYSLNLLVITVSIHASVKDATPAVMLWRVFVAFQSTHL